MIPTKHTMKTAARALIKHKTRSLLTILGIVIGIGAIVFVMSIGNGVGAFITGELGAFGTESIIVRPGKEPTGFAGFVDMLFADSLKERELDALKNDRNVPNTDGISPENFVVTAASYEGELYRVFAVGISAEFMQKTLDLEIEEGDIFYEDDIKSRAAKVIIGSTVKEELFGESSAVGESINIKGKKFEVVGVYAKRGSVIFFNVDELAVVPYTTMASYVTGKNYYTQILVRADKPENVSLVVGDIERTLRELHDISDPEDDDFYVQTQQGSVDQITQVIGIFTIFLSMVVAVSLVVGGVVVMNIMLVSVTERTSEIGLRKALGATEGDIMKQFLVESVFLTAVGGIVGITLGSILSFLISFGLNQAGIFSLPFIFPWWGAFWGLLTSGVVGLVFGLYPARQAAKKSPIEALRYE